MLGLRNPIFTSAEVKIDVGVEKILIFHWCFISHLRQQALLWQRGRAMLCACL